MYEHSGVNQRFVFPTRPLPATPPYIPPQPQPPVDVPPVAPVIVPVVYSREQCEWEYKTITKGTKNHGLIDTEELQTLGADGWELVGVVSTPASLVYYFKRLKP